MNALIRNFLQGCLVLVPAVVTGYVVYRVLMTVDGLLGLPIPGAGVLISVLFITGIGAVFSNVLGRGLLRVAERLIARVPLVRLLYTTLKDMVGAFVGDERGFDRPVLVSLGPDGVKTLGFITLDDLGELGVAGHVGVYLPQSYNFAGQLLVVPTERVQPLDVDAGRVMALIVSGGITSGTKSAAGRGRAAPAP